MDLLFRVWFKKKNEDWKVHTPYGGRGWCTEGNACERVEELIFLQDNEDITNVKVTNAIDEWVYKSGEGPWKTSNNTEIPGECFGSFGLLDWN